MLDMSENSKMYDILVHAYSRSAIEIWNMTVAEAILDIHKSLLLQTLLNQTIIALRMHSYFCSLVM